MRTNAHYSVCQLEIVINTSKYNTLQYRQDYYAMAPTSDEKATKLNILQHYNAYKLKTENEMKSTSAQSVTP